MRNKKLLHPALMVLALTCLAGAAAQKVAAAGDPIRYALCDIRVVYLYDDPAAIDWPTIYYLNDQDGCQVDLVTASEGPAFQFQRSSIDDHYLSNWQFTLPGDDSGRFDSIATHLWGNRRPDIVINGLNDRSGIPAGLARYISSLGAAPRSMFNIMRVFRKAKESAKGTITLNGQEWFGKCRERIENEVSRLMGGSYTASMPEESISRYVADSARTTGPDFLSGLSRSRLVKTIDSLMPDGGVRQALERKAANYVSLLEIAQTQLGRARLQSIVAAGQELNSFVEASKLDPSLKASPDFGKYADGLVDRMRQATLAEMGVDWTGDIILRDSPYGPKVKFISSLVITGSGEAKISRVLFLPYWDSSKVVLDSIRQTVEPHQSFVREYLVDISRQRLESVGADSLRFAIEMESGGMPLVMTSALPVHRSARLAVHFEPNFYFIQPFAALNVDKVVTSMALRAVITKPLGLAANVKVQLETPTGVFAGAYRQDVTLDKGQATETMRIPFSVSKLFELGTQNMVISLYKDGRQVASDTGIIRLASCHIEDTTTIGLLPDTNGHFEDILRMTDAKWQVVSDRTLEIGDLGAYDKLIVGSGALEGYPSFRKIRGRLEDYVRAGGTIIIMGQPTNWPDGMLPISFVPVTSTVSGSTIQIVDASHDLFKKPNPILTSGLSAYFQRPTKVSAAVISPCRPLVTAPRSEMLLSLSPMGNGRIIFCGLPLTDMIGSLNVEAIHLLANILNY